MEIKVIITGAAGLVGEGNHKPYGLKHPKLKACIVPGLSNSSE